MAPRKTPGRAIAPRRSCHSPVCRIVPSCTTEEMIVPEKTPLGKVTKSIYVSFYTSVSTGGSLTVEEPSTASPNQCFPVIPQHEHVGYVLLDRSASVKHGVQHADPEIKHRQRPDASYAEAHPPHGAVVGLLAGREYDQED